MISLYVLMYRCDQCVKMVFVGAVWTGSRPFIVLVQRKPCIWAPATGTSDNASCGSNRCRQTELSSTLRDETYQALRCLVVLVTGVAGIHGSHEQRGSNVLIWPRAEAADSVAQRRVQVAFGDLNQPVAS